MNDYGFEHTSVRLQPLTAAAAFPLDSSSAWTSFATDARNNAVALQSAINETHARGGGFVFVPPGRYYIGRGNSDMILAGFAVDVPDVLVYPDVTLTFAPRAILVPMSFVNAPAEVQAQNRRAMPQRSDEDLLVRIEVQGDVEAGVGMIFDAFLEPDGVTPNTRAGLILFTGNSIREVRPEWWGALTTTAYADRRNTEALQAAIDAGHTHRKRLRRGPDRRVSEVDGVVQWWRLPTIPVVAQNSYPIDRPLRVGLTAEHDLLASEGSSLLLEPNPAPFVMVGEREVGNAGAGRPTLLAGGTWNRGEGIGSALIEIEGISSCMLKNLTLNGNDRARALLRLAPGNDSGNIEVSNCAFHSFSAEAENALIRIYSARRTNVTTALGMVNVSFTRCRMNPLCAPLVPATRTTYGSYPRRIYGVDLDVDDAITVEFRTCFMTGTADPMINARRGHFALNECTLHTLRVGHESDNGAGAYLNNSNGTDVFIGAPYVDNRGRYAPASLTARETETQSYQFLGSYRAGEHAASVPLGATTGSRSACVLMNIHHTCVPGRDADVLAGSRTPVFNRRDHRPSVYWAGPGVTGSHLLSISSRWCEQYEPGNPGWSGPLGGIRLSNSQTGEIYLLGNTATHQTSIDPSHRHAPPRLLILAEDVTQPLPAHRIHTLPRL